MDSLPIQKMSALGRHVTMSNALARASQGLKLSEKRIIALALIQLNSRVPGSIAVALERGLIFKITAADYARCFSVSPDMAYVHLKAGATHLPTHDICYNEKTSDGIQKRQFPWVSTADYHHGEARLEINFSTEIAAHLLELRGEFISYKLRQVAGLKSIYAWRLFECLESWKIKGVWQVKIEDFYIAMGAKLGYQKDFGSLRTRIIEPAVKELNETGMVIICNQVKAGRRVTALRFEFGNALSRKPNPQTPAADPMTKAIKATIESNALDQKSDQEIGEEYFKSDPRDSFEHDNT